jgi:hypothetical protein
LISPPNHRQIPHYPVPLMRGVCAIVTDVGHGMRWTRAVSATNDVDPRTAKSRGPDAPTLASSFAKQFVRRRWQESPVTGESAEETVKTIAQGRPDETGEPVVTTLVCFLSFAREAAGALATRLSLRPLFFEGMVGISRAHCVARSRRRVWSSATKQSAAPPQLVIPRESGVPSTPRRLGFDTGLWNTGSPAFAGDDSAN